MAMVVAVALPLTAQPSSARSAAISDAGDGPVAYVLVTGMMGGVEGYDRLRGRLLAHGHRVVAVDPYALSVDSAEVTFAALARRVAAALAQRGVDSAVVVGHAHGAGVALRLAANAPRRVTALYLLDAGALGQNQTTGLSASLRLAPLIGRLPGGRTLVRRRIVRGLEENAGRGAWLDAATRSSYADRIVNELPAAVRMAHRLAAAREPERLAAVVTRIDVPVTVLLGSAAHPSAPDAAQLQALAPLGGLLRVERLPEVGHFPHEEVPGDLAARLLAGASRDQRGEAVRLANQPGRGPAPPPPAAVQPR